MENKKAFTLVELLVAMAIIAILLGLAVFGITIVQQNARDTQRRSKVNDVEIALNGLIASSITLPANFTAGTATTITAGSTTIQLPGALSRSASATWVDDTTSAITDYCYGNTSGTSLYVVGATLEGGGTYFKSNSGAVYASFGTAPTGTGPTCVDGSL